MALLNNDKAVLPLKSIAQILNAKVRTLKMYEEKLLFPKTDNAVKKLYSINDVKIIAFVHYLASVQRVNTNGIKYILEILDNNMDESSKDTFFTMIEQKIENLSSKDVQDIEEM